MRDNFTPDSSPTFVSKRVEAATPHSALRLETEIDGVFVLSYPQVKYEYGSLTEVFHPEWQELFEEQILHCYFITNQNGTRQEWHYHEHTVDRYSMISGKLEVALFDPRENSVTKGKLITLDLEGVSSGVSGNHGLRIPQGVWHSFKSSVDFTLMNFKTLPFNRAQPDKYLVSMPNNLCDFTWISK